MSSIFYLLLTQPLINALVVLYEYVAFEDLGVAIILLTILIRIILYPIFYKGLQNQAVMQKMQPEIKEIQKTHKGNREQQGMALMQLYKKHQVNPFSPFLYLLIQLPILIAVYRVFLGGFSEKILSDLYSFVPIPEHINTLFLGLIDTTKTSMIVVALAVLVQYLQTRLSLNPRAKKSADSLNKATKYMVYIVPLITLLFLSNLPAAIGLYWLTTAAFSILQQQLINKKLYPTEAGSH